MGDVDVRVDVHVKEHHQREQQRCPVAIGHGIFGFIVHKEATNIIYDRGPCQPQMPCNTQQAELYEKVQLHEHNRGGVLIIEEPRRPESIVFHGSGPVIEDRYQKVTPKIPGADPRTAEALYNDAALLNTLEGKTHLKFNVDSDGYPKAGTQGLHGFFQKNSLEKVEKESANRNDAGFVTELLGGPNSGLQFDGKRVIITHPLSDQDKAAFQQNADAIGEAVRGHYDNAKNMYASILNNGGKRYGVEEAPPQHDSQPTPPATTQTQHKTEYSGSVTIDGKKYQLNPDGSTGNEITGPQPAAAPTQPATATVTKNLDEKLIDKAQVGEAQMILNSLAHKHVVRVDGIDTRRDGTQGETDRELSKVLGHNVSNGMTQRDLNELETKAGITADQKNQILDSVAKTLHLSGVTHSEASPTGAAPGADLVKSAKTALDIYNEKFNAFKDGALNPSNTNATHVDNTVPVVPSVSAPKSKPSAAVPQH